MSGKLRVNLVGWMMILPAMVFFVLFMVFPIFKAFQFSLYDYSGYGDLNQFIGLQNYKHALQDPIFFQSLWHNLILAFWDTLFNLLLGFLLAYFLSRKALGWQFFNVALFIPSIISVVVVAIIWKQIYDPQYGLLNSFFGLLHLDFLKQNWLGSFKLALPSVIVAMIWKTTPFNMLILFANMLRIPSDLLEAAKIDGARERDYIRYIVFPMMLPVIGLLALLSFSSDFRAFDMVWVLTEGGPIHATEIATSYIYKVAFNLNHFGYGNALAFIVMFLLFATIGVTLTVVRGRGGASE